MLPGAVRRPAAAPGTCGATDSTRRRVSDGFPRTINYRLSPAQRSLESFLELESAKGLKSQAAPALAAKAKSNPEVHFPALATLLRRSTPSGRASINDDGEMHLGLRENLDEEGDAMELTEPLPRHPNMESQGTRSYRSSSRFLRLVKTVFVCCKSDGEGGDDRKKH